MKDLSFLAAMGKAGGGKNEVDPRFISLFSVFNMTFPSNSTLYRIYSSILAGHVTNFTDAVKNMVRPVTRMTMTLYT